jgi:hypothetical protein
MRLATAVVALILWSASGFAVSAPVLRVASDGYDLIPPVTTFGSEIFIYSDRLTVEDSHRNEEHTLLRGTAPAAAFNALARALGEARVGTAPSCEFGDPRMDRGRVTTYRIAWFGRAGRTHSFTVTRTYDVGVDQCPLAIRSLIEELGRYSQAVRSAPDAIVVRYSTP